MPWVQIVLAVAITVVILLQKNEASLGSAFGGGGDSSVAHTKRGIEKGLFVTTIVLASLFIISSIIALIIRTF